jgi:hypothetical protein
MFSINSPFIINIYFYQTIYISLAMIHVFYKQLKSIFKKMLMTWNKNKTIYF